MRTARARRRSNSTSTRRRFRVGWGQRTLQCFGTPTARGRRRTSATTLRGDTHTVTLSYATPVAVVALEPGRVEVVESVVPADQVRVGHETALRATVENPGDRPTTRNLTVSMNGESVAEREVALDPGENATVQIRFRPRESGTVSLEGNEVGAITLFDDDDGATSTDAETNEDIPGFGVIVAVLALLVTAFGARVRRS